MINRKSSLYSGKTKNSSIGSYMSMQSLYSKNSSQHEHSLSSYKSPSQDQTVLDMKRELREKDTTISLLQKRIEDLINDDRSKSPTPTQLHKLIKKGDKKLDELKKQIEIINKENESLVIKQKELLNIIAKYRKENQDLKQCLCLNRTGNYEGLEFRLKEIEKMHEQLIGENLELKSDLVKQTAKTEELLDLKFSVLSGEIYKAKIDIGQVLKIFRIMKSGKELDFNILLHHREEDERFLDNSYKHCSALVMCIRKDIEELKNMISDFKAERYGSNCITQ